MLNKPAAFRTFMQPHSFNHINSFSCVVSCFCPPSLHPLCVHLQCCCPSQTHSALPPIVCCNWCISMIYLSSPHQQKGPHMSWSCCRFLPAEEDVFLPLLFVWGHVLGFWKEPVLILTDAMTGGELPFEKVLMMRSHF